LAALAALLGGGGRAARAESAPPPERGLRYDWKVDGAITAAAFVYWGTTELFKEHLAASTCRWCADNSVDASVRDALRWNNPDRANLASNIGAYGVLPLATVGLTALAAGQDGRWREMGGNALVIAEAVAISGDLSQTIKFATGRERPFVHALPESEKPHTAHPADNNVSFYSSHSSFAFSLAVSCGTVASLRGYRWAPAVWAVGLAGAAAVGYLRIGADKHYFSDVMTGAVAGSTVGFLVPYLFHRAPAALALAPIPGGGTELILAARW
jgi:membrane-associated phospholipid phosphatase